jgi:hypothetical protein
MFVNGKLRTMRSRNLWDVRDKRQLLLAMTRELAGDARISFEGSLRELGLLEVRGGVTDETMALRRSTLWFGQDFLILPLEGGRVADIMSAIGPKLPRSILHIQFEKNGVMEFAAYDNFHPECICFGPGVAPAIIDDLVSQKVLRPT